MNCIYKNAFFLNPANVMHVHVLKPFSILQLIYELQKMGVAFLHLLYDTYGVSVPPYACLS